MVECSAPDAVTRNPVLILLQETIKVDPEQNSLQDSELFQVIVHQEIWVEVRIITFDCYNLPSLSVFQQNFFAPVYLCKHKHINVPIFFRIIT